jgi:hypothetical protein
VDECNHSIFLFVCFTQLCSDYHNHHYHDYQDPPCTVDVESNAHPDCCRWKGISSSSDYGGPTVYYSVRPCGETLFDLLGTLPLDDFGLLSWAVLDKEEEIFESDDVKDEQKVMLALWGRWIMLNR